MGGECEVRVEQIVYSIWSVGSDVRCRLVRFHVVDGSGVLLCLEFSLCMCEFAATFDDCVAVVCCTDMQRRSTAMESARRTTRKRGEKSPGRWPGREPP